MEERTPEQKKCACQSVLHKFNALQTAATEDPEHASAELNKFYTEALSEVLAAHFETAIDLL